MRSNFNCFDIMNKLQNNLNSNKFGFCNKICYYYNGFVEKK